MKSCMQLAKSRKVVLVLCGGGSKGAVEVGFYCALVELGVPIDWIVGASIRAINGAFIAAGMPAGQLAEVWWKVTFSDIEEIKITHRKKIPKKGLDSGGGSRVYDAFL
jgi:NTE family protein